MQKEYTITEILNAVRQCNDTTFRIKLQRISNNKSPKFSDDELIAIYIWGISRNQTIRKRIYGDAKALLSDKFPLLPSYQAFCRRLNRIFEAFQKLAEFWQSNNNSINSEYVIDSCPIMLAKHSYSNNAKVAKDMCHICHNSTRDEWYYGMKLHAIGRLRRGTIPSPCALFVANANLCDLWAAKDIMLNYHPISNGILYADKGYVDAEWAEDLKKQYNIRIITPHKKHKDEVIHSDDIYSTCVASKRQPIESFFNWLNVHTGIEDAHLVRSREGLLLHIYACLATAQFLLHFNS